MSEPRDGLSNLTPWKPGDSGNPEGSSRRARARAAAKRIGGLAPALREMLDSAPPTELLASLSPEQQAMLDGSETLARFLGAKLLSAAASATNLNQLLSALALIAQVDGKSGAMLGGSTPLDEMIAQFPAYFRIPLEAAFEAFQNGEDPVWPFQRLFDRQLDENEKQRLLRAGMGDIDLRNYPRAALERFKSKLSEEDQGHLERIQGLIETSVNSSLEALSDEDREHLDRLQHELRCGPFDEKLERFMNGEEGRELL